MSVIELRSVITADPDRRAAAWAELRFRNQSKAAFERENGHRPEVKNWTPPTFLPPGG